MRISDWSSDVCSSDLLLGNVDRIEHGDLRLLEVHDGAALDAAACLLADTHDAGHRRAVGARDEAADFAAADIQNGGEAAFHQTFPHVARSEERRVGQGGVSAGSARWARSHKKK